MAYPLYNQCENSIQHAVEVLELLRQRRRLTLEDRHAVHRRRRTAAIALQTTFQELRDAFITPIDREDLWLLRHVSEAIARAAENVVLDLIRSGRQALNDADNRLLASVTAECRLLSEAVGSLASYPRSDAPVRTLNAWEQQHRQSEEADGVTAPLAAVSDTCFTAAAVIRYVALRSV